MGRATKYIITTISIIFLIWFSSLSIFNIGFDKTYITPPQQNEKINAQELSDFLELWGRMMNGRLKKYANQISLNSSSRYPRPIVKWLDLQNWNVERYFYIEQRLMQLIEYINLRKNLEGNIEVSGVGVNLNDIIADQKKKLETCPFDDDEMDLIEKNFQIITQTMSGNLSRDR